MVASVDNSVLHLEGVHRNFDDIDVLRGIDWTIEPGERWVVLGPNGSGKTTLIRIASMWLHPSAGEVTILGHRLGRTDVRTLRRRIGFAGPAMATMLRPDLSVVDVVMTAANAALEPWWHTYDESDRDRAVAALARTKMSGMADRRFGTLSSGERQRVLLARALSDQPELILLDEPTAALDLAGRELLLSALADLAGDPAVPPIVLVTHHVEEIPAGFTHALVMRHGEALAQGPLDLVLTSEILSKAFGISISLERRRDRWLAWAN